MNLGFETEYVEYKLTTNELDDAILDLGATGSLSIRFKQMFLF